MFALANSRALYVCFYTVKTPESFKKQLRAALVPAFANFNSKSVADNRLLVVSRRS